MQRIGKIGSVVEPIITPKAKRLVVEVPIYFNQYIPGVEDGSLEVIGVFFDELAERVNEMALKDVTREGTPTQGKGMMVEVLGKLFTDRYKDKKDGRLIKITKMYVFDVCYPNIYGKAKNTTNTTLPTTPPVTQTVQQPSNQPQPQQVQPQTQVVVQENANTELPPVPNITGHSHVNDADDPLASYNQLVNQ